MEKTKIFENKKIKIWIYFRFPKSSWWGQVVLMSLSLLTLLILSAGNHNLATPQMISCARLVIIAFPFWVITAFAGIQMGRKVE